MPRRHDHDAAGDPEVLEAKAQLRDEAWAAIRSAGATRFPGPEHRIPNFVGAEAAAELLRGTEAWKRASTLKANPDSPQLPVRQRALEDAKTVFMAVPRLARPEPFFLLDPDRGRQQKAQRQGRKERHAGAIDQDDRDIAARHREGAVRQIDEIHQAERHGKSARQHEQQHAVSYTVEQNGQHARVRISRVISEV